MKTVARWRSVGARVSILARLLRLRVIDRRRTGVRVRRESGIERHFCVPRKGVPAFPLCNLLDETVAERASVLRKMKLVERNSAAGREKAT
jgi:hypothetical protein